ncbi:MAG: glycerol-3-phosphate O-acyltransferase PlsB [Rhodobacteraceae bacterium HLUCCA08]|nr:MAG: glycerol-3-phosphate O-acyltransferase PlsB [Rhodobacteraceae bacterium HLUCCA08]
MTQSVAVPLWLLILILLFAAVTFASHFLFPSVRWFFRKRAERVVARLNRRLAKPIEPFKLARRFDMIQRLIYDPQVTQAIVDHAREEGVPENVAFERARRYAREIVPAFSASAYFGFGTRLARWLSRSLYRVHVGQFDQTVYDAIDPEATVVFVMNHRSNMDYVLVTYLVAQTSALSYAVGEWARVWPLSAVIRSMGAYFIRRRSRGALYRRVLARYVQMATDGGVTQAVFPEGGLSVTGRLGEPRLGILSYIAADRDPTGREIVFVPVALNYDWVLEDRILVAAAQRGDRRFRPPRGHGARAFLRHVWQRLTRRFERFGRATVSFGAPLSMRDRAPTEEDVLPLGRDLMDRIAAVMPVLPVPLVARLLLERSLPEPALRDRVQEALQALAARDVPLPHGDADRLVADALAVLRRRGLVVEGPGGVTPAPAEIPLLHFYAASIEAHFDAGRPGPGP